MPESSLKDVGLAVFAYNFPHRKTQEVLTRLFLEGYKVDTVIAADPVKLSIPKSTVRTGVRHVGPLHPREVAARLGANYVVMPHASEEIEALVRDRGIRLGLVAGARIIKEHVIDAFPVGIINLHPGLIPEARGLDAMLWAARGGHGQGVTSHLIDRRVDAGVILERREIPLRADDTVFDVSQLLFETQLDMIAGAIERALSGQGYPMEEGSKSFRKMPAELEQETVAGFGDYVRSRAAEG